MAIYSNEIHFIVGTLPSKPATVGKEISSILDPDHSKAKDVKSCTYCCYVRCSTLIVGFGGMPWSKTDASEFTKPIRTSWQSAYNQRVVSMQLLRSKAFGPA